MSAAAAAQPKRHRRTDGRVEGRRGRDPNSSQDASEEDNDASDVASMMSMNPSSETTSTASSPRLNMGAPLHDRNMAAPIPLALNMLRRGDKHGDFSEGEGMESPTYDGDIESSSTIGTPLRPTDGRSNSSPNRGVARAPTPKASRAKLAIDTDLHDAPTDVPVADSYSLANPYRAHEQGPNSASAVGPPRMYTRPVELTEDNIRGFVQRAIEGRGDEDGVERWWRTAPPPEGRPVRIYADGVYDLCHFGHALQLRQAKLSFPHVHLLVGVCSDELCANHKSAPAMTHAERCEAIRHIRWADEVLPDAPWVVDQAWLEKYEIDYIAHDEYVYPTKDMEDVYAWVKGEGKFLPTRRTPSISTSDLLERIVRGYRDGFFDSKLEKNGQTDLLAADVDWDSDKSVERRTQRRLAAARAKKKASS